MDKHLHIVSFAIPYPPNYGGVIDVYYLVKSMHENGIKVHLHCFQYNRGPAKKLEEICYKVSYYKRHSLKRYLFNKLPFIVISRKSDELLNNLIKDDYPILFDGIHCCYYLDDKRLKNKLKIVRTFNIEHIYYLHLAKVEINLFKKYFFYSEAYKLAAYDKVLKNANHILAISRNDYDYLKSKFKNKVELVPAFHPYVEVMSKGGKGEYALYHGNLSVGENNKAALYLINEVFNNLNVPLIIAGMQPSTILIKTISNHKNIRLVVNPSEEEMIEFQQNAHVNILPTFQQTGIKLKLLSSLYQGRFCIVNSPMVINTGLEDLCIIADSAADMKNEITKLFERPFEEAEIKKRQILLSNVYSNSINVQNVIKLIFPDLGNSISSKSV